MLNYDFSCCQIMKISCCLSTLHYADKLSREICNHGLAFTDDKLSCPCKHLSTTRQYSKLAIPCRISHMTLAAFVRLTKTEHTQIRNFILSSIGHRNMFGQVFQTRTGLMTDHEYTILYEWFRIVGLYMCIPWINCLTDES